MKAPKPIKAFKHKDAKRAHIPSAEEAGYEAESAKVKETGAVELPLNPVITRGQDPELFWMHKYGSDEKLTTQLNLLQEKLKASDLSGARTALENLRDIIAQRFEQPDDESLHVDIRSLYRHEHIAPETLIKGLYRVVAEKAANQDELFAINELFGNAIGHEELDKVSDYYTHSDGWTNRLIQGDSLLVMTSLLEREGMSGAVQCIYLDPPYGIKYGSNWQIRLNNRTVKDGDDESLSGQPEQVKAFRDTWELGIHSYLSYLRERLLVARELLHESGSCFVQISDENVHLVRNLMDEVFGSENFCSLITVRKTTATVEIAGLDIYDPIKDEVKSRDVHDIAYWMVDDDYDGSNFVVRQVFFCGGDKDEFDEWKRGLSDLAKAATKKKAEQTLKLQIDDEAFARIYGHKSHPFAVKAGQKIAVRVISQFGEETTKVLEVK